MKEKRLINGGYHENKQKKPQPFKEFKHEGITSKFLKNMNKKCFLIGKCRKQANSRKHKKRFTYENKYEKIKLSYWKTQTIEFG